MAPEGRLSPRTTYALRRDQWGFVLLEGRLATRDDMEFVEGVSRRGGPTYVLVLVAVRVSVVM